MMRPEGERTVKDRFQEIDRKHNVILFAGLALGVLLLSVRELFALAEWAEKVLAGGIVVGIAGAFLWAVRSTALKKTALLRELGMACPKCGATSLPGTVDSWPLSGPCPKCGAKLGCSNANSPS